MVVDHHSNSCMSYKENVCNTSQVHKRLCTKTPNMDLEFCNFGSNFFANPFCQLDYKIIVNILMVCVVLHNMILEDEHDE
jgi:hypothetical protein